MIHIKNFFYTIINLFKSLFLAIIEMAVILMLYDCKIIKADMFTFLLIIAFISTDIFLFIWLCEKK